MHGGSTPPSGTPSAPDPATGAGRPILVTAALGWNAWACLSGVPAWYLVAAGELGPGVAVLCTAPLLLLALGALALRRRAGWGSYVLALLFPAALIAPSFFWPVLGRAAASSTATAALAATSLAAHLVASCWAANRVLATPLATGLSAIDAGRPSRRSRAERLLDTGLVASSIAVTAVVVAAALLEPAPAPGEAAEAAEAGSTAGHLLASSAALLVSATVLFWVIAPALTRRRQGLTRASRGAAIAWIGVVVVALVMLSICSAR